MQWNQRPLAPGDSMTITTDHGYRGDMRAELACGADRISLSADSSGYAPNPFMVRAVFRNTGFFPIPSATLRLLPPPGVTLAPGEFYDRLKTAKVLPTTSQPSSSFF